MSLCLNVGHKLTEGTNEMKVTCKSKDYCYSVSCPGYNQQFTIPYVTAFFKAKHQNFDLKIDKENVLLKVEPNFGTENIYLATFPLENGKLLGKFSKTFLASKENVPFTALGSVSFATDKNSITPSILLKKKNIENYSLSFQSSAQFVITQLGFQSFFGEIMKNCVFAINAKKSFYSAGLKLLSAFQSKGLKQQLLLSWRMNRPTVNMEFDVEPIPKKFALKTTVTPKPTFSFLIGLDNLKSDIYSVAQVKHNKEESKHSLILAADTLKTAKIDYSYRYDPNTTIQLSVAKDFTNKWAPKIGLFCTFND